MSLSNMGCFRKARLESLRLKRATLAGRKLRWCPVCDYDLIGLPSDHTCPKCGFAFSPDMRIWGSAPRAISVFKARRLQLGQFLGQLILVFFAIANLLVDGILAAVFVTAIAALPALAFWYFESWSAWIRHRGFIIVEDERLVWGYAGSPAEALAWTAMQIADDRLTLYQRMGDEWVELPRLPDIPVRGLDYERLVNLIRARCREANEYPGEALPLHEVFPRNPIA